MKTLNKACALGFVGLFLLTACGEGGDDSKGLSDSGLEDAGATVEGVPDASPITEDASAAPLDCRTSDIPPLEKPGVNAEPREACSNAQIQAAADCLAADDCNAWIGDAANRDCASCVFTGNELRGPYYRSADGKNTIENSAGCVALRSNDACGQAIIDSEFCLQLVCAYCEDDACIDAALKEECLPAEDVVATACAGVELRAIARGCLAAEASAAAFRATSVEILNDFCGPQP